MTRMVGTEAVNRLLSEEMALEAMRSCFRLEGEGRAGPAQRMDLGHRRGWMRVLPAVFEGLGVFGSKTISFNPAVGVRYAIDLYDLESGDLRALVDGEAITAWRTGATAAVAADLLCPPEVAVAAIVGTGSVARAQLTALQAVRPASEVRVYSRRAENRQGFIDEMHGRVDAQLVEAASLEGAVEGAALVTLATKSEEPVLLARHLRPGVHVNSVGSARPALSELEPASYELFDLVVCDAVDLVFSQSGDAIGAVWEEAYDPSAALPLADLVVGRASGRTDAAQLTLFKSTGTGLQDLALAVSVLEEAERRDEGVVVDDLLALKEFGEGGRT